MKIGAPQGPDTSEMLFDEVLVEAGNLPPHVVGGVAEKLIAAHGWSAYAVAVRRDAESAQGATIYSPCCANRVSDVSPQTMSIPL